MSALARSHILRGLEFGATYSISMAAVPKFGRMAQVANGPKTITTGRLLLYNASPKSIEIRNKYCVSRQGSKACIK